MVAYAIRALLVAALAGTSVAQILSLAEVNNADAVGEGSDCYPSIYEDQTGVSVQGVVTSLWDNGFTIQDTGLGAVGGLFVYTSSANPPLVDISPAVGDVAVVTGRVIEYFGLTEITSVSGYTVVSSGNTVDPIVVTTGALGLNCSSRGERYEGVLVEIRNATISNEPAIVNGEIDNQYVTYPIDDGSG
eukprot:scaffold6078_cov229-Pinguiococcus_pyrenoidosus.AAC.1